MTVVLPFSDRRLPSAVPLRHSRIYPPPPSSLTVTKNDDVQPRLFLDCKSAQNVDFTEPCEHSVLGQQLMTQATVRNTVKTRSTTTYRRVYLNRLTLRNALTDPRPVKQG